MTAHTSASPDVTTPFSPEEQAAALWTFVHLNRPRFPYDAALEVVKRLAPRPKLCAACDEFAAERPARVFHLKFGPAYMMLSAQVAGAEGQPQSWPLLVVNPLAGGSEWLDDAPPALERLRRHLEEVAEMVLDGVAAMQLCNAYGRRPNFDWPRSPGPGDACNSELILVRADHELDVGYEIARGDEMTCWYQFDLAIKDHQSEEVTIDEEYGAWHVGGGRYVWKLSTLRPKEFIPGLMIHELGVDESQRLLRRYRHAKRVFGGRLARQVQTKRLEYLGSVPDTYRVDLHKLLLAMNKAGLTWEGYCAETGESVPMDAHLAVGFVLALLERLKLEDPNAVFARPNRAELERVDDDKMLRTLLPRVDHVRYKLVRGASTEVQAAVRDAIEELSSSLFVRMAQEHGQLTDPTDPLPYLVFGGDGEELRAKLAEHGLVIYAGVMPNLRSTKGLVEQREGMWPFAIGHSLYLDIDFDEAAQGGKEKGAA